jgi:hypothetical protein
MSLADNRLRRLPSPGFLCALVGILVTALAWFGPWAWPAWPAMGVMAVAFSPARPFADLSYGMRSAVVVVLTFVNVACWALVALGLARVRARLRRRTGLDPSH